MRIDPYQFSVVATSEIVHASLASQAKGCLQHGGSANRLHAGAGSQHRSNNVRRHISVMDRLALWDPVAPTRPLLIFDGAAHQELLPAIARVVEGSENRMYKDPIFERDASSKAIAEGLLRIIGRFLPSISEASSADDSGEVRAYKGLLLHPVVRAGVRFSDEVHASQAACMPVDPAYAKTWTMACPWVKTGAYAPLPLGMDKDGELVLCSIHQIVMWALHGPPPPSKPLCLHMCEGTKHCVNPLHLTYGSVSDNALDREAAKRRLKTADLTAKMAGLSVLNKQRKEAAAAKVASLQEGEWGSESSLPTRAPFLHSVPHSDYRRNGQWF